MSLQVDSSPQADFNWLFTSCSRVPLDQLARIIDCVHQLARGQLSTNLAMTAVERAESFDQLSAEVNNGFDFHTFPPAAVGQQAEAATEKVHALLWSFTLESESFCGLEQCLDATVSITSDMEPSWFWRISQVPEAAGVAGNSLGVGSLGGVWWMMRSSCLNLSGQLFVGNSNGLKVLALRVAL